ncbi:MAG: iron chelate uptake ABC transporter family permease subunit [candidate division NC10 bacterium]|nr:iron chelate uptake ABC transporter family permease subunit [candidate division NC10 bacterium]
MIHDFLASWALFHNTYLAGWLIGLLLAFVGVLVVARDQIFLGAAITQVSTLGIALGMWISSAVTVGAFPWLQADGFLALMAVLFSVTAALVTARGGRTGGESHEGITGWVFLISASLSILLVAHSPHGLQEIHRLLSSSLIGATRVDVWAFGALLGLTLVFSGTTKRRLLLLALDPAMAEAVGMRASRWDALLAAWLGLTVGLALRSSGMLYTFGCLVLPALCAKHVVREVRSMFLVAPLVALSAGVAGFVLAHHYDFPPAQMTIALLGFALLLAWGVRWLRHRMSAA